MPIAINDTINNLEDDVLDGDLLHLHSQQDNKLLMSDSDNLSYDDGSVNNDNANDFGGRGHQPCKQNQLLGRQHHPQDNNHDEVINRKMETI
jgi:hypothetical protein